MFRSSLGRPLPSLLPLSSGWWWWYYCSSRTLSRSRTRLNLRLPPHLSDSKPRRIITAAKSSSASKTTKSTGSHRQGSMKRKKNNTTEEEEEAEHIPEKKLDVTTLKSMTVKELKAIMRESGIPPKGSKQELISALSATVARADDLVGEEGTSSAIQQPMTNDDDSKVLQEGATKKSRLSRKKNSEIENTIIGSVANEPWALLTHKKPQPGWVAYNPKVMRPPPLDGDIKCLKVMSWNVNGLRALLKTEASAAIHLAKKENFDILCLQETKMQEKDVDKIKECLIDGYDNSFWTCSVTKLGYSGTAIISRIKPVSVRYGLGVLDHDNEGRLLTVEFDDLYLLNGYVPNSGDGLKRLEYRVNEWDKSLSNYMKELEKSKPVILTGDLNCAHEEIDIYNPAGNRRSAGFTDAERKSFESNFLSKGFVDTFRRQHPSAVGYSYYGYRHGGRKTNRGWRLDYFLVSDCLADKVYDSYILPDVLGSDHCPIGLTLKL